MAIVTTYNHTLRELLINLKEFLSSGSYNFTENDLEDWIKHINETIINNEENITSGDGNCRSGLNDLAQNYGTTYHPYFAVIVCLLGTVADIINVIVLSRKDMICVPVNRILAALAVTDMLVMAEYIPYIYYYYVVVKKNLDFSYVGALYMLLHAHVTQTLHTSSICLTLMLAVWRYLTLSYPENNRYLCSHFRCTLGITISYFISLILCLPTYTTITITTQDIIENKTKYILYHTDLNEMFRTNKTLLRLSFWFYAVFIKLLPCFILTVISFWLIHTICTVERRKRLLRNNVANIGKRQIKAEHYGERTTRMLVAVLFFFLLTEFPQGMFAILIGIKGKDLFLKCYQLYGEAMDILALSSGVINFMLYCYMSKMFRIRFGRLFTRNILKNSPSSHTHKT